jgi:hypothetical protein
MCSRNLYSDDRQHCAQGYVSGLACGFGQSAWKMGTIPGGWKEEYACVDDEHWSLLTDGHESQDYGHASPAQCIGVCDSLGNYTRALSEWTQHLMQRCLTVMLIMCSAVSAESICVCGNEFSREPVPVNATEFCDRACPGDYSTQCGGTGSRIFKRIE